MGVVGFRRLILAMWMSLPPFRYPPLVVVLKPWGYEFELYDNSNALYG